VADEGGVRSNPRRINAFHTVMILDQHENVMHDWSFTLIPACS